MYGFEGYNNNGQLGLGNPSINNSTDTSGGLTSTAFYSANVPRPVRLPQSYFDGRRIVDMWSSRFREECWFHALDDTGQLWAWGHNQHGELGVGNRGAITILHLQELELTGTDTAD